MRFYARDYQNPLDIGPESPTGGWFPGGPLHGGFSRFINLPQPGPYTADAISQVAIISQIENAAQGITNIPAFLVDQYKAQTLAQFNATAEPANQRSDAAGMSVEEREFWAENNQYPSAFDLKISTNPVKWVEDPMGELKKAGKDILTKSLNYEDIDRTIQANFIGDLLAGKESSGRFEELARKQFVNRATILNPVSVPTTDADALQLRGLGLYKDKAAFTLGDTANKTGVVKVDLAAEVADSIEEFARFSDSGGKRVGIYNKIRGRSVDAIHEELKQKIGTPEYQAFLNSLDANTRRAYDNSVRGYMLKLETAQQISKLQDTIKAERQTLSQAFAQVNGNLDASKIEPKLKAVATEITNTRNSIASVRNYYVAQGDADLLAKFDESVSGVEKVLNRMTNNTVSADIYTACGWDTAISSAVASNNKKALNDLTSLLDGGKKSSFSTSLEGIDVFSRGALADYHDHLFFHDLTDSSGDARIFGNVVGQLNLKATPRITTWAVRSSDEFIRESYDDLVAKIGKGEVLKTYLYGNRLKGEFFGATFLDKSELGFALHHKLKAYTPANFAKARMADIHQFGLVIRDDKALTNMANKNFLSKGYSKGILKVNDASKRFSKNGFGIFENSITIDMGGIGPIKFIGGSHMDAAIHMGNMLNKGNGFSKDHLGSLFELFERAKGNKAEFLRLLNSDPRYAALSKVVINMEFDKFFDNFTKFHTWLTNNKAAEKLGLFDAGGKLTADGLDKLDNFLRKISIRERSADLVKSASAQYSGLLQRLVQNLNEWQTQIFGKNLKVTKWLAPITHLKIYVSEALAKVLATWAASLTGGLAGQAVYLVSRFVIRKGLDIVQSVGKAIRKGDPDIFMSGLEQSAGIVLRAITLIFFFIAMLIYGLGSTLEFLFSPISPANNSKPESIEITAHSDGPGEGYDGGGGPITDIPPGTQSGACAGVVTTNLRSCPVANPGSAAYVQSLSMPADTGHGSSGYWANFAACSWSIPFVESASGCPGPNCGYAGPGFTTCKGKVEATGSYGRASDIQSGFNSGVYLPDLPGVTEWNVGTAKDLGGNPGMFLVANGVDDNGEVKWVLGLLHLTSVCINPGTYPPGQKIADGTTDEGRASWPNHIHIELARSDDGATISEWVKPEEHMDCR